ncbi:hypothetical protein C8258_11035 [Nocardia sp. MDA0666]|uniref:hypothetical protein n=1 Tax=Nocardia sp. MDA0666 TaxID=2135448 RepID=UPI000D13872E|nr:hypothetical protein [Nocardia sp. MDA0666]PSR68348.1 hypothetical protein C8258_11035 [Nocardia sp. MDA0666]
MRVQRWVAATTLAIATVTASSAHAAADPALPDAAAPAPNSAATDGAVHYRAVNTGAAAVITTDSGSMDVSDGIFRIRSAAGAVLAGIPLTIRIDDVAYPVEASIRDHTAILTPAALPFEDEAPWRTRYEREQAAFSRAALQITTAAAGGAGVGTAIGGIAGCVGGALVGAVVTGILAALFGAGPLAGCLAGMAVGAGIGAFAGALLVAAPVAVASVIQYFTTINEPFVPKGQPAK